MTRYDDEIAMDAALVAGILRARAPDWCGLPIRPVASGGTDNALFRLGRDLVFRAPRRRAAVTLLAKELDWLPRFGALPLEVPVLRFRGRADPVLACDFGILDWIEGEIATPAVIADPGAAARSLARFLAVLHDTDTAGAPAAGEINSRRGVALAELSATTLPAIDTLAGEIDADRARGCWRDACAADPPRRSGWLHGDLKADNLIARNGVLHGVIDWGLAAVGDPAADHAAAWSWVAPEARATFRDSLDIDDAGWLRARGWALYGAVIALSHYRRGGNDALCRQSRRTLGHLGLMRAA